jgi:hypothetical protein
LRNSYVTELAVVTIVFASQLNGLGWQQAVVIDTD